MVMIVCYDVDTTSTGGARRLRRIAEACKDFGVRVQYSVFECRIEAKDWVVLRARLLEEFDPVQDSLRFYFIDDGDASRTEHHGVRKPIDVEGLLMV
jgi:CRISPR-associated protein Cas2